MDRLVLLDCDGVLSDFVTPVLVIANRESSLHWDADFKEWDFLPTLVDPQVPDLLARVKAGIGAPGFCASMQVYPGAVEGVAKLREVARIKIVTSPWPSPTWHDERVTWLKTHFGIGDRDILFAADKTHIHGSMLVDDNAESVEAWHRYQCTHAVRPGSGVIWDQHYNRSSKYGLRAAAWNDVLDLAWFQ